MAVAEAKISPRFKTMYESEIRPRLMEGFGYASTMQAPRLVKITLNMGVGDAKQDTNMLEAATEQLAVIAEERRKEEARQRAEAEQAALEQLKAENPEAYERRERAEEGEPEGEREEGGADETASQEEQS